MHAFRMHLLLCTLLGSLSVSGEEPAFARFRHLQAYYTEVGVPLKLEVEATTDETTLDSVEFFVDGLAIGSDVSSPFSWMWTPTEIKEHKISARAVDDQGLNCLISITSSPVFNPVTSLLDQPQLLKTSGHPVSFKQRIYILSPSDNRVYKSENGTDWEVAFTASFGLAPYSLSTGNDLIFVRSESSGVYFSEDGDYWHHNPITIAGDKYDPKAVGNYFIAKKIHTPQINSFVVSVDLREWFDIPKHSDISTHFEPQPWIDGRVSIINGSQTKDLYVLNDAFEWEKAPLPSYVESINRIVYAKDINSVFLIINRLSGDNPTRLIKTSDGTTWDIVDLPANYSSADDLLYKDDVLILNYGPNYDARAFLSFDQGASWTESPVNYKITGLVSYLDGYLVLQNGLYFTKDGIQYSESGGFAIHFLKNGSDIYAFTEPGTYQYIPIYRYSEDHSLEVITGGEIIGEISGFCRSDSAFVAVAEHGIVISADTLNWESYPKPTADMDGSIAFGNGLYVADLDASARSAKGYAISEDALNWELLYESEDVSRVQYFPNIKKFVRRQYPHQYLHVSEEARNWQPTVPNVPDFGSIHKISFIGKYLWVWYHSAAISEIRLTYTADLETWILKEGRGYSSVEYGNGIYSLYEFSKDSEILMPDDQWITPDLPNPRIKSAASGLYLQSTSDWETFHHYYSQNGINWTEIMNPTPIDRHNIVHIDGELYGLGEGLTHSQYDRKPTIRWKQASGGVQFIMNMAKRPVSSLKQSEDLINWSPVSPSSQERYRDTYYIDVDKSKIDVSIYFKINSEGP